MRQVGSIKDKEHKRYERERKGEGVDYEIVQHII